jgi:hypothetical protein
MDYDTYKALVVVSEHSGDVDLPLVVVHAPNGIDGLLAYERLGAVEKMPHREAAVPIYVENRGYFVWALSNAVIYSIELGRGERDIRVGVTDGLRVHKEVRGCAQRGSN